MEKSINQIQAKLLSAKELCFSMPERIRPYVNEIWIYFSERTNFCIDLEQPFPTFIQLYASPQKGWFSCSDEKKRDFIQYRDKDEILSIIAQSKDCKTNLSETVAQAEKLLAYLPDIVQ